MGRCCDRSRVLGEVLPETFGETNPLEDDEVRLSVCIARECMFRPGLTSNKEKESNC